MSVQGAMEAGNVVPGSSYGRWVWEPQVQALRRYRQLLRRVVALLQWLLMVEVIICAGLLGFLMVGVEFERIIFFDGTELSCMTGGK